MASLFLPFFESLMCRLLSELKVKVDIFGPGYEGNPGVLNFDKGVWVSFLFLLLVLGYRGVFSSSNSPSDWITESLSDL